MGEFLRKRRRIQVRGKFLIHKKVSNTFGVATYRKNALSRPALALRNMPGPTATTFPVPALHKGDLVE